MPDNFALLPRPTILIVDDNLSLLELCQEIVSAAHPQFAVETAPDLARARELIGAATRLALGIIDREVLGELADDICWTLLAKQVPFLRITDKPELVPPPLAGCGVITKPVELETFRVSVSAALLSRSA